MDHATLATAISGLAGLAIGTGATGLFVRGRIAAWRAKVDTRDATIEGLDKRCIGLRQVVREKDQSIERLTARVAELEPDAAAHREHVRKRDANLAKAQQTNRERHAAKAAGNVSPLPKRKRA